MVNSLTVRLPKSLHEGIKQLAKSEGISINQFLVTAAAEKMSALLTQSYLEKEALLGVSDCVKMQNTGILKMQQYY